MNTPAQTQDSPRAVVLAWLAGLQWDGRRRLFHTETLARIFRGDATAATLFATWFYSAVMLALRPGRATPALALIGLQGYGKSGLLRALFGEHMTSLSRVPNTGVYRTEALRQIVSSWAVEITEPDHGAIKNLAAIPSVTVRFPYERTAQTVDRWWSVAFTSSWDGLGAEKARHVTYIPISVPIDVDAAREMRDQLFAEAYHHATALLATLGEAALIFKRPPYLYVASSWRNARYARIVERLTSEGFVCYDFKKPDPSDDTNRGFAWSEIDPAWQSWTPAEMANALAHPVAVKGFAFDANALAKCDACVLVLPCGRSAHLEAGFAAGAGKPVVVFMPEQVEPELMYGLCHSIATDANAIAPALARALAEVSK